MVEQENRKITMNSLLKKVDKIRINANKKLNNERKEELGQFFTDSLTSKIMAKLFDQNHHTAKILDPGAGVGCLTAALIVELCKKESIPKEIMVTVYEKDPALLPYLQQTLDLCGQVCKQNNVHLNCNIIIGDFIEISVETLKQEIDNIAHYNYVIMNPPYRKIKSSSKTRRSLRSVEIEETNLYSAFLIIASRLLETGGELVAITPRSFCNGPYFKNFRYEFTNNMCFKRIHTFEARNTVFNIDKVIQENIIMHVTKTRSKENSKVVISTSSGLDNKVRILNTVTYNQLIHPMDPDSFIRLVKNEIDQRYVEKMKQLSNSLRDLGISVSTGKVVDFRVTEYTTDNWQEGTVPLIYPCHFSEGDIIWPNNDSGKPNAIELCKETLRILVPKGIYVLVKRFSAKEERKRIVSSVFDPAKYDFPYIGFENHLNFYHINGEGLLINIAKGLSIFLNSTLVDNYFRQFNGHTQVNVADLKDISYPSVQQLELIGGFSDKLKRYNDTVSHQYAVDLLLEEILFEERDGSEAIDKVLAI